MQQLIIGINPNTLRKLEKKMVNRRKSIQLQPNKTRDLISIEILRIEVEVERLHLPELKQEDAETQNQKKLRQKQKIPENHL